MIKLSIFISAMLLVTGCSSTSSKPQAARQIDRYQVINLGPSFSLFWQKAKGLTFREQIKIWNSIVEEPNQSFYDGMVWQKSTNPKWEERKLRLLKDSFANYPVLYPKIIADFDHFNSTLKTQIDKFHSYFPDSEFNLPIYAAPTASFNGKGGEGGDSAGKPGQTVLAFGIDMSVALKNDPDVLYSHELFHIYHTSAIGLNEEIFTKSGRLSLPLWLEGLATYVSQQMNPTASSEAILMDSSLSKLSRDDVRSLSRLFLNDVEQKAFDVSQPGIYKKWFAIDPAFKLPTHYPMRSGYFLGLNVVTELAKTHSLAEMVHWHVTEIHSNVKTALFALAR